MRQSSKSKNCAEVVSQKTAPTYPQVIHRLYTTAPTQAPTYPQVIHRLSTARAGLIHRLSTGEPSKNNFARQAFFQLFFKYFFPYKSITYKTVSRETHIFLTFLKKPFIISL